MNRIYDTDFEGLILSFLSAFLCCFFANLYIVQRWAAFNLTSKELCMNFKTAIVIVVSERSYNKFQ